MVIRFTWSSVANREDWRGVTAHSCRVCTEARKLHIKLRFSYIFWINSVRPKQLPQKHKKKQNIGAAPFRCM